jgi:dUTP pyrophosphatase
MSLYVYISNAKLREQAKEQLLSRRWTDSGFDILTPSHEFYFSSGHLARPIYTGIFVATLDDNKNHTPCMLVPRSSLSSTPLRLANSIGLIDMGYRGEVIAKVDCVDVNTDYYAIDEGKRLFQLVQYNWLPWKTIVFVDTLEELPPAPDNRAAGGFGSTGH